MSQPLLLSASYQPESQRRNHRQVRWATADTHATHSRPPWPSELDTYVRTPYPREKRRVFPPFSRGFPASFLSDSLARRKRELLQRMAEADRRISLVTKYLDRTNLRTKAQSGLSRLVGTDRTQGRLPGVFQEETQPLIDETQVAYSQRPPSRAPTVTWDYWPLDESSDDDTESGNGGSGEDHNRDTCETNEDIIDMLYDLSMSSSSSEEAIEKMWDDRKMIWEVKGMDYANRRIRKWLRSVYPELTEESDDDTDSDTDTPDITSLWIARK